MAGPTVTQAKNTFSMECRVAIDIGAEAQRIWGILTDGPHFPRWNSTVTGIEGEIRDGQRLRVHAPGTDRTFNPLVSNVVANRKMTWTGGFAPMFKGVRTFELKPHDDGTTEFVMRERFAGLMLPMVKGSLPDFRPIFARYAEDLKTEAERPHGSRP